jgi:hypothetical protein
MVFFNSVFLASFGPDAKGTVDNRYIDIALGVNAWELCFNDELIAIHELVDLDNVLIGEVSPHLKRPRGPVEQTPTKWLKQCVALISFLSHY